MSDLVKVTMPRLGESVTEGTLVKWLVQPGARVVALDVIAELDTDKVTAEIPTPVSGSVRELLAREGEVVQVGAAIAVIEQAEPERAATPPPRSAADTSPAPAAPVPAPPTLAATERHQHSPAVRELARENDIDLSTVAGTGVDGRITRADVMRIAEERKRAAAATVVSRAVDTHDVVVPLGRMRRSIAERMTLSKTTIPHAWQSQEVDMTGVVAHRNAHKGRFDGAEGFSLTYLPYIVAATAAALRAHPYANATFDPTGIVLHHAINIGVAVGLDEGVIVPVIRRANELSLRGIARAIDDLTTRARAKKLTVDDLSGATFTVNNSGTFGTVLSYSVIDPGQAGILTMGAIKERVVAIEGRIAIRPMMFLSFSLDHRVLDGLGAARFVSECRRWLELVKVDAPIL